MKMINKTFYGIRNGIIISIILWMIILSVVLIVV